MPWRGGNLVNFVYYAETKGKGDEAIDFLFSLFHDSKVMNLDNTEVLKTVGIEIGIMTNDSDIKELLAVPEVKAMAQARDQLIRDFDVKSTPTVLFERSMKVPWSLENMTNAVNYLLK